MHGPYRSHYKTWQHLKAPARAMRHEPTPAESILWETVRDRRLSGYKFRRQYTIGRFIVDFVCLERKLIIEVDGEIHQLQVRPGTPRLCGKPGLQDPSFRKRKRDQ